jgi:hypothetical protein
MTPTGLFDSLTNRDVRLTRSHHGHMYTFVSLAQRDIYIWATSMANAALVMTHLLLSLSVHCDVS